MTPLVMVQLSYGWLVPGVSKFRLKLKIFRWRAVSDAIQLHGSVSGGIFLSVAIGVWLVAIAVIDLKSLRIPDALTLPMVASGLSLAWLSGYSDFADRLIGAGAGYLTMAGFGQAYFRLRGREGLGLGDAKLFAAAGAWLGWQALPFVLLIASVGGLCWVWITRHEGELAFGPWLALGFWLCLTVGSF